MGYFGRDGLIIIKSLVNSGKLRVARGGSRAPTLAARLVSEVLSS